MPAHVNSKGKRVVSGGGLGNTHITYEYKSPGVNFPNERKSTEQIEEEGLAGGVTITQLTPAQMETYVSRRRIGRYSSAKK